MRRAGVANGESVRTSVFTHLPTPARASAAGVLAAALALAGCATAGDPVSERIAKRLSTQSCVRVPPPSRDRPQVVASAAAAQPATAVPGFSEEATETARAIGVHDVLVRYAERTRSARTDADRLATLRERQRLADRVLLATLDVQGVVAELQCERERGARLEFVLAQRQAARDRRLTMTSIVSGAATGILGGAIGLAGGAASAADAVSVVGGATEGGFGVAGLFGEAGASMHTERNLLAEVWSGPERPELWPAIVWRMLNAPARDERDERGDRDGDGDVDEADARPGGAARDGTAAQPGEGRANQGRGDEARGNGSAGARAGESAPAPAEGRGGLPDRDAAGRHDGRSIRERLVAQWKRDGGLGAPGSADRARREALFFGRGGRFTAEDLQWRASLLDSLQARVWLINIDLEQLLREVVRPDDGPER